MHTTQYTDTSPTFSISLTYKSELEVDILMLFTHSLPPSHANASCGVDLWHFDAVRTSSISLARKTECVGFYCRSRLLHLPCMQQRVEGGFMTFEAVCACSTLPRMQEPGGGGPYSISTSFAPPPLSLPVATGKFLFSNNSQS